MSCDVGAFRRTGLSNLLVLAPQKILVRRPIPQEPTSVVPRACRDGAEAEAPIVPEGALVESAPAPVDVPKVGQTGGGMTEASPADAVTA